MLYTDILCGPGAVAAMCRGLAEYDCRQFQIGTCLIHYRTNAELAVLTDCRVVVRPV